MCFTLFIKSIVTLLSTETRDTVVTVASGKNISLDLNGNDLVMVSTADATFYGLTNKGTLEIIDSVGGGEIKASLTSTAGNYNVYGIYNDAGTLTVKGGTITGTNPESKKTYARGICNVNGAITIMGEDDGAISTELPKIVSNGIGLENYNGTMYFYDGLIIGNKDTATSGTIKVADGYYIKEIDTDSQTTAYLEEIVIDESKAMITTWNIPAGTEIKLPISSATNMNIVVDWGDGTLNQYIGTTFPTHTYADAREYEIKVQGTCASWGYNGTGIPGTTDNYYTYTQYLTKVNAWGELGATMYGFSCCSNLNYVTSDIKENSFTNLNTMRYMFFRCTSLTSIDLSKLNTSKVTDMMGVFEKATALEKVDVRGFDTSKVTNMESFVYDCTSLKDIKLGSMSATYVTTTQNMFRNCPALTHLDLSGLRLSRVTDMDNMFDGCTGLRSMLVNETFVVPTASTSIFNNNTSLQAIIITSAKPTSSQFTNAVSKVPTQTIFYVPTEKAETLYENSWAADFSEDRIDHIFELIGEENIRVNANGEFVDEGYLVADYTVDNSDEYTVYGYNVNVDGNVDTSVDGTYKLTYTLTRTYLDGTNSVTEVVDTLSRKVEVVTPNYLVDGVYYSTLAKAYEAIKGTEGTIIVRQDNVDNSRVIIEEGKIVTINTNGKTIEKVSYGLTNKGGLIISGTGTIETDTLDKLLINEGVLEVTNGTIVNNNGVAIENKTGDLTIGVQGDDVSGSAPVIQGSTYAIVSESGFDFYDGALKGQIASYDGEEPEIEVNCFMKSLVEEIDGIAYQVVMLKLKVVYPVIDFTASNGESDDSITLSWLPNDANEDYVTYEIQVLDESGKWQVLSEDATSPFVHEGLKSNTVFEYNIRVYDEIIGYSAYSYAEGFTKQIAADVNFIKDTTRPVIQNVAVTATGTTVDLNGMVSVTFETFDENYLSSETTLSADTIILKAGDEVIENASIEMTKVDISSGERFTFKLKNLDGAGELNLVVPVASIRDKAGLGILETVIPTGITVDDQKPETVSNFRAKCDDDLSMILTFEKLDESVKVVIQELDENGEWVTLSENATSPFIRPGVEDGKTYEYRAYTVSETGKESDYAYAIGYTSFAEASIIIRNDNIKPDISFAGVSPEKEFINSKDEIVITLDVTDANYNYDESDITSDDVAVTVGGVTNTDAIKTITKVTTVSGETYKIAITNITGIGDLGIAISGDSIIDKAGNGNDEKSLDDEIEIYVANGTIGDQAPTVDVDESIMTVTSNQQSVYDIVKIEYQYRESGETEFITASSNVIEDTAADTYYEVRTVVTDAVGNVQESQVTIAKTDSMDSSKITITADVETFTSGDVMVTITYGGSNFTKEYSIDGSTWYEVEDDEIVLTIKENTTVYARLADIKTNTESVSYVVDNIDKQKPTIGNVAVTPAGKANSKEMIVTGIEDVGVSGIYGYYISTEADLTAPTWVVVSGDSFTQTLKEDGTYYVWVNDNAGNVSAAKIVIVNNIVTKVTSVEVPDSIEVQVGEMINIPLTYSGEAKDITYTSDDESIVLIEPNIKQIVGVSSGDTTVKITITNYDGSTLEAEVKVIVRPVEIIAIVTSDGEEYSGDWTNKDVYVTLSANGVVPADYKEKVGEDGEWQVIDNLDVNAVNGNGEIVYSGDFSGDIYYIGYNEDGNAITAVSDMVTIKLDKTAPTIGTADKEVDTNSIIVRITGAIDVLSGISGYEIGIYSGDEVLASYAGESGDVTFKGLLSSTTYGIKYRVIDNAGNATELIDGGTATTGEIIRTVTYDYLTNGGETVSMESDTVKAGTEVNLVVFATKTGYEFKGWSKTPDGDILEKLIMPEEDITLFAIFKDETAPVVSDKDYETVDGDLDIILKAEDEGAGVKDYAVTTDEGTPTEWFDVEEDENGEIRITVPGTNKYYVWIRDINGNYTRYEQIAIKDIYAPTGTIEVSGDNVVNNLPYSRTNEVLLKVTASDNESADSDIKIAIYNEEDYLNITNYSQINFAYTYTGGTMDIDWTTTDGDGLKRIYVIFKDKAGNISMTIKEIE